MGLLKEIKYSTFRVSALNGIVDEWTERMNILGVDFMSLTSGDFERTRDDKLLRKCNRKIRHCGKYSYFKMMTTVIDI